VTGPNKRERKQPAEPVYPLPSPQSDTCVVGLRFGVSELLGLMVLCALLFSVLQLARAPWYMFVVLGSSLRNACSPGKTRRPLCCWGRA